MYIRKRNSERDDNHLIDITVKNFKTSATSVRQKLKSADKVIVAYTDDNQVIGYLSESLLSLM